MTGRGVRAWMATVVVALVGGVAAETASATDERSPLVIGHRGASGYLPEHTLEGYALAMKLGADYVEPDLVATKDGHLVARHEPNITSTTDVAAHPEFAGRRTTKTVDGVAETGFFASDFTLAELRTLRALQTMPDRPQRFNGRFGIPTLREIIALVKRTSRAQGRRIGIYPETKHPTYHQELGLPLERRLVAVLDREDWNHRGAPVFVQSFEQANLKLLDRLTRVRLVQLIDANDVKPDGSLDFTAPYDRPYDWTVSGDPELQARLFSYLVTDAGLDEVATYADGIGPWKPYIQSNTADGKLTAPTDVVTRAHARGLLVHPYTFRNEARRLAADYGGNPIEEYLRFYALGVDGVFSDFPDTAVAARELFALSAP